MSRTLSTLWNNCWKVWPFQQIYLARDTAHGNSVGTGSLPLVVTRNIAPGSRTPTALSVFTFVSVRVFIISPYCLLSVLLQYLYSMILFGCLAGWLVFDVVVAIVCESGSYVVPWPQTCFVAKDELKLLIFSPLVIGITAMVLGSKSRSSCIHAKQALYKLG